MGIIQPYHAHKEKEKKACQTHFPSKLGTHSRRPPTKVVIQLGLYISGEVTGRLTTFPANYFSSVRLPKKTKELILACHSQQRKAYPSALYPITTLLHTL